MNSTSLVYLWVGLGFAAFGYAAYRAIRMYRRFRGKRLVTCPENQQTAAVALDATAATREAFWGKPHFRLAECSRWPERRDCGQPCLGQIESNLEGSLVQNIVAQWYAGKRCAYCGKPIVESEPVWADHKPALASRTEPPVEWDHLPPERLPEMFQTRLPVCWSCQVAEAFRRRFPEQITDRPPSKFRIRF